MQQPFNFFLLYVDKMQVRKSDQKIWEVSGGMTPPLSFFPANIFSFSTSCTLKSEGLSFCFRMETQMSNKKKVGYLFSVLSNVAIFFLVWC